MPRGQGADIALDVALVASLVGTDQIANEAEKSAQQLKPVFNNLNQLANAAFISIGAAAVGMGAAAAAGIASLIQFEDAFAGVRKTVDADEAVLQRLSDSIRDLATELPVAATELARIGELGGQLGIGAESLEQFIEVVTKLSVATVLSTENAALALARLGAIANIPEKAMGDFFERTGASIVELGNNFAATEDEIITTVLRIATAAEQSGASTQDALAFATALQAIGVPAQAGGTAVARVFQEIQRAIQNGGEQLNLFSRIADMSSSEFVAAFEKDASMAVVSFIEGLSTAEERVNGLQDVLQKLNLSQRRTQLAIGGLATAQGLLRDALITSRTAFEANVALNVEAAKKFATTKQQLVLLKNQIKEFTMEFAEGLLPMFRSVIFSLQAVTQAAENSGVTFLKLGKILTVGVVAAGIAKMIVLIAKLNLALKAQAVAATGAAVATATATGNLAGAAIAITTITAGIIAVRSLLKEASEIGGQIAFADTLKGVDEFAKGASNQLKIINENTAALKQEFLELAGIDGTFASYEDFIAQIGEVNMANLRENLGGAISDADLKKIENAHLFIESMDKNAISLDRALTNVFDTELEKLVGTSGPVGEFFKTLNELPQTVKDEFGVDGFLKSMLLGDSGASEAAAEVADRVREQLEGIEMSDQSVKISGVMIQQTKDPNDQARKAQLEFILGGLEQIEKQQGVVGEGVAMRQKQKIEDLATEMLQRQGIENATKTEINNQIKLIKGQREEALLRAKEQGITKEMIGDRELSAAVRAHDLAIQDEILTAQEEELNKQFEILTEQETIAKNVVSIARESARGIVSLFNDVPDQIQMSASEITRNLQDQAVLGAEFVNTIQALQAQGFTALAAMLAEQGPAALTAAQDFLRSPALAAEAESNARLMNEPLLRALAEIPDEADIAGEELMAKFEEYGGDISDGLSAGIREHGPEIRQAIIEAVENGEKGLILEFGIKSPAQRFIPYGQAFADALALGMEKNGGKFTVAVLEAAKAAAEDLSTFTDKEQNELMNFANSQIEEIENQLNQTTKNLFSGDAFKEGLQAFKNEMISSFDLVLSFDDTFKQLNNSQREIADAQKAYNDTVAEGVKRTKQLAKENEKLTDLLKKFGEEGVVTSFETLQNNKAKLRLLRMETDLKKSDRASERLAIKDAKREIDFLEQAVKRGVATEDELQAAKERLAEMQGTTVGIENFQGRDDFESILKLQDDIAKAEIQFQKDLIKSMADASTEESEEIVNLRERIAELEEDSKNQADDERRAQDSVNQALHDQVRTRIQLFQIADKLVGLGPEGIKQFKDIATAAGMPQEQIDKLIGQAEVMGAEYAEKFGSVSDGIFKIQFEASQGAKLTIDTEEAHKRIANIKKDVNSVYDSFGLKLPFPDISEFLNNIPTPSVPDKDSMIDKMLHKGGFAKIGTKALVGEFGPEILSVTPQGARVTPTGIGAAGGISVENVIVNVTGVPSDPQSARKAAMSIRKALVNLEKEGSSSSILGR